MELFGHLERFAAGIYPYRWFFAVLVPALLVAAGVLAYRRGWQHAVLRHRVIAAGVAVPLLIITILIGYYLLSPLWTRTHLEEESPLDVAALSMPAESTADSSPTAQPSPTVDPTATMTVQPTLTSTPVPEPSAPPPQAQPTGLPAEPTQLPEPTVTPEPEPTPEPDPTSEPEAEPTEFVPQVVLAGEFYGADDFHFGSGSALLIATTPDQFVLRLEDFSVQNGPDLFVYLSTNPNGWSDEGLNLGELRATDGSFNYDVPVGVDIYQYQSVVIWCRAFAVLFATAPIM